MKLVFPTQPSDFASFGLPVEPGAIIVQAADANSPALDTVGPGPYEITAINGRALDGTLQSYCQIVGGLSAGQTAVFHIVGPDGQTEDATIPFE
jgi:S1-C subfamily serine protease